MAIGSNDHLGCVDDPAGPPRPKPKPPERNDYNVIVDLLRPIYVPPYYRALKQVSREVKNQTARDIEMEIGTMAGGFSKVINGGVLTLITKYNIAAIHTYKKERNVTDALPEGSQSQSTAADGVLSPSA